MLDKKSPIPLFYQLKSYIESQISSSFWKPGDKISTEQELGKEFQISRTTVRQAINELVNEGKLVRIQGKGTFVAKYHIDKQIISQIGFSEDMQARGLTTSSKILNFLSITPPPQIIRILNLKENDYTILLKRLRFANDNILALETTYLPQNRFPNFLNENMENNSLYTILETKYETIAKVSNRVIESIKCPSSSAPLLEVTTGFPILKIITTSFDQFEQPFEYTEGYYRGDRYNLNLDIINQTSPFN